MNSRSKKKLQSLFCLGLLLLLYSVANAQPGETARFDKPEKYEKRTLPSERPTDKPIRPVRRITQNLGSHYNFHFNAFRKLQEILLNAQTATKDDFSKLLPFYKYTLENTSSQASELDSVIAKCNDAILLHDLRSDWVDDMYLLMGKAYFYRNEIDSALLTFQYLNYAFQPRTKDEIGYPKSIGSNSNADGNVYTISTKENNNPFVKLIAHTPARNESLLWLIRSLIEKKSPQEAWSLIATLKRDAQFPKRLQHELQELQALLFYQQQQYDSAAHYLEASLPIVEPALKARQEYLLAQLYERAGLTAKADEWYERSMNHTTDLIQEAYARINRIRMIGDEATDKQIEEQIAQLLSLAKKEKYADYTHIIFYAAAQLEKTRQGVPAAIHYLHQSALNGTNDPAFRSRTLLELGDLAWEKQQYRLASMGYDSLSTTDPGFTGNAIELSARKAILSRILTHMENIRVEDSLLRIAALPENQRNDLLKNLLRQLRKEQGIKEDASAASSFTGTAASLTDRSRSDQPVDLFSGNSPGKGEWYFYNASMKARGQREFQTTWGNRPNADNWRRAKAIAATAQSVTQTGIASDVTAATGSAPANAKTAPASLTLDGLYANLPLQPEQVKASEDTIESSLYILSKIFREELNDCSSLISNNESLLNRFPKSRYAEEIIFGLHQCYTKTGNAARASALKTALTSLQPTSRWLRMINDPKSVENELAQFNQQATLTYENIYRTFIEGNFNQAIADKKRADSTYGDHFWTPQLLHIEAVYHIRQRDDSIANSLLQKIRTLFPTSPMAPKAALLADVLARRNELEKYLTELQISRNEEENVLISGERAKIATRRSNQIEPTTGKIAYADPGLQVPERPRNKENISPAAPSMPAIAAPATPLNTRADTTRFIRPVLEKKEEGYSFRPTDEHWVFLVLEKIDIVYLNEAKNALNRYHRDRSGNKPAELATTSYSEDIRFISISQFSTAPEAHDYLKKTEAAAGSEIFPWLPKEKYSFLIITRENLARLLERKELARYRQLFAENIPLK